MVDNNNDTVAEFERTGVSRRTRRSWMILCDMHSDMGGAGDCAEASWVRPCLWSLRIDIFWLVVPPEGARQVGLLPGGTAMRLQMRQLGSKQCNGDIVCLGSKHVRRRHRALFRYIFGSAYKDGASFRRQQGRAFTWLISTPELKTHSNARLATIKPPLALRCTDNVFFCIDEDFAYCVDPFRNGTIDSITQVLGPAIGLRLGGLLQQAEVPLSPCTTVQHATVCIPRLADALTDDSTVHSCCRASLRGQLASFNRLLHARGFDKLVPDLLLATQFGQQADKSMITDRVRALHTLMHRVLRSGARVVHLNICISPKWTSGLVHSVLRRVFLDVWRTV